MPLQQSHSLTTPYTGLTVLKYPQRYQWINEKKKKNNPTPLQKRNMVIWILGLMFYKLGLETFQGSITIIALEKWGEEKHRKYGLLRGLDQLFQCIGSILVAPLIRRFPTRNTLTCASAIFSLLSALPMIIDASTNGRLKTHSADPATFNGNALFPIICASGIAYGTIELIRRVIPRDIVGGDIAKLQKLDALVHILYEVSGTLGAFFSWFLISSLGSTYSLIATPGFFLLSSITWYFLGNLTFTPSASHPSCALQVAHGAKYFCLSVSKGARIIFTSRQFVWLPLGYSLALYAHRYLENGVIPIIAEEMFHSPAYSRIFVCGSNLGELIGAASVFLFGRFVPTPIPWLRGDALLLLLVWVLPFYLAGDPATHSRTGPPVQAKHVWRLAPLFIPISFGWAAGDVSLGAYIQSSLSQRPHDTHISSLGAVMAFLYSTYIFMFAVLSPALGAYADGSEDPRRTLVWIAGAQFTVVAAVLLGSTFVPRGAGRWNPGLLEEMEGDEEGER